MLKLNFFSHNGHMTPVEANFGDEVWEKAYGAMAEEFPDVIFFLTEVTETQDVPDFYTKPKEE